MDACPRRHSATASGLAMPDLPAVVCVVASQPPLTETLRRLLEPSLDAGGAYVQRSRDHGVAISMAARGNPYENARAEAFFKTRKTEEVSLKE